MRVVGVVCRWCREEGERCLTLGEQKKLIRDFCKKRKLEMSGFVEIDGTLHEFVEKVFPLIGEKIGGIVVCGRNYMGDRINDSYWIEKELFKRGGILFILKERTDVPPKVLLKIRELVVDIGKRDIEYDVVYDKKESENVSYFKGKLPIGYKYENGKIVIDEGRRKIIEDIFKKYKEFKSLSKLKKYVDERGYLTDRKKKFTRQSLWVILTNRSYVGIYERRIYKTITSGGIKKRIVVRTESMKGIIPPLIEKSLFDDVQQILTSRGKNK